MNSNIHEKRFDKQFKTLESLLKTAAKAKDPGLYLYQKNFRAPLFQLEALARIYTEINDDPKHFKKLLNQAKKMEDLIGQLDYFAVFVQQYQSRQDLPKAVQKHFVRHYMQTLKKLNRRLEKKGWLSGKRIRKFRKVIRKADLKVSSEDNSKLREFYLKEIREINEFTNNGRVYFDELEAGVHELRRKLRWLSIYATALNGGVQLAETLPVNQRLKKYLTPEIVQSPYNTLPSVKDKQVQPLLLSRDDFYALSWMIDQLGRLKDRGLDFTGMEDALLEAGQADDRKTAMLSAKRYLKLSETPVDGIFSEASRLTAQFFKDQVLARLVIPEDLH